MEFRKACACDLGRIMEIVEDGRAALASLGIDQWQGGYPDQAVFEEDIAHGESYVAEEAGAVAAIMMSSFRGEPIYDRIDHGAWLTDSSSENPNYGVVHRVAVGRDFRGQGAASFLIGCAEELARRQQLASVRIDTHPGNAPMRKMLAKLGYAECGIVYVSYAGDGVPERIAFEKVLA